jgi:hypothetical protein
MSPITEREEENEDVGAPATENFNSLKIRLTVHAKAIYQEIHKRNALMPSLPTQNLKKDKMNLPTSKLVSI